MKNLSYLKKSGLFETQVPRYTSYPAANFFTPDAGQLHQRRWLQAVPEGAGFSLYIHIPFCKRLCWFCACRTQGTKTLRPVAAYVETLRKELHMLGQILPRDVKMQRLHLGGGTPTILSPELMRDLLDPVFERFASSDGFEFSVEIDPTEVTDALLHILAHYGMNRASIGVQDFDARVQGAIGRPQTFAQTAHVVEALRKEGVKSLNMDLLYGLPHQTEASLGATLHDVTALQPDRIALYGYAHVPWMSKRQVMIDEETLPDGEGRYKLAQFAQDFICADGFEKIGIDHFARPDDSLAIAHKAGKLRRNFQGYTDDQSGILIGMGASAISRFPQGYTQNISATSAYSERIREESLAGQRGYILSDSDQLTARMIEALMCHFSIDIKRLENDFPKQKMQIESAIETLKQHHDMHLDITDQHLYIHPNAQPLIRIIAQTLDRFSTQKICHSNAI